MKGMILFFLIYIKIIYCYYLIYPFFQNKYDNLTKPSEIISSLLKLEYITNITIGEPPQTIQSFIDFTKFHFYISNVSSNREYILENSHSFNTKYDHDFVLYTYSFLSGKYANETLILDLKDTNMNSSKNIIYVKDFTFSMPSELSIKDRKMFPSSIGLGFYAYNSNSKLNFLTQLKLKGVLNNTFFFFNFINDYSGNLYLGQMPHEIYPQKYLKDNYYRIYTNINNVLDEWSFRGDLIYNYDANENNVNDSIYRKNMKIVLDLNLNGLILDYSYFHIFNKTYFNEYFTNDICSIKKEEYYYIYCQKDKININNFKTIYFYQNEFNFTFSFDYKDLFIIKSNYYIFNIFFDENGFGHILNAGKILLKKYLFTFDYEQKMIGLYLENNEKKGLIIEDNNNYKKIILISILSFVVLFLLVFIFIFIKYCLGNKGRKLRKNELDENYDYSIQKNEE